MDLPADLIQGSVEAVQNAQEVTPLPEGPRGGADEARLFEIARLIKTAKAPLVVIGKGAAYAKAELEIRELVDRSRLPFLPTPMGKGVVADSHPLNTASARSTALKEADVVLLLGARLNWILHFGDPPKWNPSAVFIQVDISAAEIGLNRGSASLSVIGDLRLVVPQLIRALGSWFFNPTVSLYAQHLTIAKSKNSRLASEKASVDTLPMTYARAFSTIERTLQRLSPVESGGIVYVSEGANTMDISRSIFPVSHPRLRLDAGTHATMGIGLGYAIAAHAAYNSYPAEATSGPAGRKKIVALEGDSAFGFSAMEVETMARYEMDILIFVMNNSGVYHGDSNDAQEWTQLQKSTTATWQSPPPHHPNSQSSRLPSQPSRRISPQKDTNNDKPQSHPHQTHQQQQPQPTGLRSTSLTFETRYEKLAQMTGDSGLGFLVRTPEELERATEEGFRSAKVCVVNVIIEAGERGGKLEFGWQAGAGGGGKGGDGGKEKEKGKGEAKL